MLMYWALPTTPFSNLLPVEAVPNLLTTPTSINPNGTDSYISVLNNLILELAFISNSVFVLIMVSEICVVFARQLVERIIQKVEGERAYMG